MWRVTPSRTWLRLFDAVFSVVDGVVGFGWSVVLRLNVEWFQKWREKSMEPSRTGPTHFTDEKANAISLFKSIQIILFKPIDRRRRQNRKISWDASKLHLLPSRWGRTQSSYIVLLLWQSSWCTSNNRIIHCVGMER